MGFIDKKDPVVLNIKLTTCGREQLSTGSLSFSYFAIGDSEIDYSFTSQVNDQMTALGQSGYTPFYSSILQPADVNPQIISFIPKNISGTPYNIIPSVPQSTYIVTNPVDPIGFFTNTTGNSFTFIVDSNHVKQPDAMVNMNTVQGGTALHLFQAPTYGTSGNEPAVGDLLLVKWTLNADTIGYSGNTLQPTPYLFYQISAITSGSLANNNLVVQVDRELPDFGGIPTVRAGAMVYYNFINYSGNTIFNDTPTDYMDESVLTFLNNSQCPTVIFPFWNMTIIFTDEIAGILTGTTYRKFTQFNSRTYGGFVSYIQNQSPVLKKLGVIHYTNPSPANVYGEGFYLTTPVLNIPTIMWHKSTGTTLGVTLKAIGSPQLLTGLTKSLDLEYYDLADPDGNIVGKVFTDLKIFVIEDQELLFAMSYKSNRSWTLPNYVISNNPIVQYCPPV
jgi:hypothetical protein